MFSEQTLMDSIYTKLITNSGVSGSVGGRIYQDLAPDNATDPCVVFTLDTNNDYPFFTSGAYLSCTCMLAIFDKIENSASGSRNVCDLVHREIDKSSLTVSGYSGVVLCSTAVSRLTSDDTHFSKVILFDVMGTQI